MSVIKNRALTLLAALAVAATGCQGEQGLAGKNGANGTDGANGTNGAPGAPGADGTNGTNGANGANGANGTNGQNGTNTPPGLGTASIQVSLIGTPNVDPTTKMVSVRFTLSDSKGFPVDVNGIYSVNTAIQPRFALARQVKDAAGNQLAYKVLTQSGSSTTTTTPALSPTALNPLPTPPAVATAEMTGLLVENGTGAGDYTYTFPVGGTTSTTSAGKTTTAVTAPSAIDPAFLSESHTIWIQISRQTDLDDVNNPKTFTAVNAEFNFVPDASSVATKREVVQTAKCSKCHSNFKPEGLVTNEFHSAGRMEAPFCNICHNPERKSALTNSDGVTPAAASQIFVHRIHNAKKLQAANVFHGINETAYPQDLRNCAACHDGAAQGGQAITRPTRSSCGSCHDNVFFDPTVAAAAGLPLCTAPLTKDANEIPIPCVHFTGGTYTDDTACAGCHSPTLGGVANAGFIGEKHVPVAEPNPASILVPVTTGSATTGVQVTATCTAAAPCTCGTPAGSACINPDYTFVTSGTVSDKAFFSAAGVACSAAAPCTCTATAPCFANPFTKVSSGFQATAGFAGTVCGKGTETPPVPVCATCTPGSPCVGAGNNNTNAAFLAAAGAVPAGAAQLSYDLKSVSRDANLHPVMVFRVLKDGVPVVFNTFDPTAPTAGQELMPNFVGSPSLYWVYAVPQDNIQSPADYNGSTSVYLRSLWNNTATTSSVGTLTGPDTLGYYTATLTGSVVPNTAPTLANPLGNVATMLTGGIGYTYGLSTTPPFTQTNVTGYPYDPVTRIGGLIVPAADVKKVATGFTGRRQIIDNAKCKNCHVTLGANPTFHAGQRNDGESCSWCHNPNQNNSGWSGNAKDMIHAVHAGTAAGVVLPNGTKSAGTGKRSFPYTWDAVSQNEGFWEVTFPGPRNNCEACHATQTDPNLHTYDFSAAASAAAVPNLLWSTEATNGVTLQNFVNSVFGSSPYITTQDYGANVSVSKATGVLTPGADTNLMTSPITAACIACHDSPTQKSHIIAMNGQFYVPRSIAKGLATTSLTDPNQESCLICHGPQPNAIAPIADMHKQ